MIVVIAGYICGKCGEDARVPLRVEQCQHVCCFPCWKTILSVSFRRKLSVTICRIRQLVWLVERGDSSDRRLFVDVRVPHYVFELGQFFCRFRTTATESVPSVKSK